MNRHSGDGPSEEGRGRSRPIALAALLALVLIIGGTWAWHTHHGKAASDGSAASPGRSAGQSSGGASAGSPSGGTGDKGAAAEGTGDNRTGEGNGAGTDGTAGGRGQDGGAGASSGTPPADSGMAAYRLSEAWPQFGNNAWQTRFSPIAWPDPEALTLTKVYDEAIPDSAGGNESYPLMENGVLYLTTGQANVLAVDAASGKIRWRYEPKLDAPSWIPRINRGVAIDAKQVYVLTPDNRLIALDKKNGKPVYSVTVADTDKSYFESMAPIVAGDKVIVGSSGGDQGIRGFIAAYAAATGKQAWRFYTVPERGTGWMPREGYHGGGAVWTSPAYDAAAGIVYAGTGNPSPDYYGASRQGHDPYTDSVVGLDAATGKLVWWRQEVPHDLWDYDVASPPMVMLVGGRKAIGEAGKDGFWYEWDAATGKPLFNPVAFVKEKHSSPTPQGVMEWPGPAGGANYGPSAYNPLTGQVFVAGINGPEVLKSGQSSHDEGNPDLGTGQTPAPVGAWSGTITAIDAKTGALNWQVRTDTPPIGGVTAAGGWVLFGESDSSGTLTALAADSGKRVWSAKAGAPIGSAPIVYRLNGSAYVTFIAGGAKSMTGLYPYKGPARIETFKLGGGASGGNG